MTKYSIKNQPTSILALSMSDQMTHDTLGVLQENSASATGTKLLQTTVADTVRHKSSSLESTNTKKYTQNAALDTQWQISGCLGAVLAGIAGFDYA